MLNFLTEIPFCPQNQSNLSVCLDLAPVTPTVSSPAVQSPAIVKPVSRVTRIPAVYLSNLVLVIQTRVGCMPAVKWRHMVSSFFVGFNVDFKAYISYLRNLPVYNLHYVIYLSIIFISPCVPPQARLNVSARTAWPEILTRDAQGPNVQSMTTAPTPRPVLDSGVGIRAPVVVASGPAAEWRNITRCVRATMGSRATR